MPPKFINVNFWTKKYRKMQSKSGTPKIDTPKIDAFSSFEHYYNASIFGEGLYLLQTQSSGSKVTNTLFKIIIFDY